MNPIDTYLRNIKFLIVGFTILAILGTLYAQYKHIESLKKDVIIAKQETSQYKQGLDFQNNALLNNEADYKANLAKANNKQAKIVTRYKVIYQGIDSFGKDKNETCNDAISYLNNFAY